ncbi:MAG TPA: signal recognition particle-docking protein FtsY [Rhabdochlamydiaceae bacterium]|jgi:fused signal recognition particle receptor
MFSFIKAGFQKIKQALGKTRSFLSSRLRALFSKPLDEKAFEELEHILFEADLGSECAMAFVEHLRQELPNLPDRQMPTILKLFHDYALSLLKLAPKIQAKAPGSGEPLVILIVGVNGTGKTTSVAKLAHLFARQGKSVLLAAADTFRAAAIEQLSLWAERLGIAIVKGQPGGDSSAVAFDALSAAKARATDVVLIDTAGRLQNKTDLMRELEKLKRVCAKVVPSSPHETLLVLDATTGQNAIDQARIFNQFTPLTGIILAKLDGSAKGGIILSIYKQLGIPIKWIGVGEKAEDVQTFDPEEYVNALFDLEG